VKPNIFFAQSYGIIRWYNPCLSPNLACGKTGWRLPDQRYRFSELQISCGLRCARRLSVPEIGWNYIRKDPLGIRRMIFIVSNNLNLLQI